MRLYFIYIRSVFGNGKKHKIWLLSQSNQRDSTAFTKPVLLFAHLYYCYDTCIAYTIIHTTMKKNNNNKRKIYKWKEEKNVTNNELQNNLLVVCAQAFSIL